ncbi:hypothetical protein VTH06DRAFT_409 [Thermothelomyces fergusii]
MYVLEGQLVWWELACLAARKNAMLPEQLQSEPGYVITTVHGVPPHGEARGMSGPVAQKIVISAGDQPSPRYPSRFSTPFHPTKRWLFILFFPLRRRSRKMPPSSAHHPDLW